MNPNLPNDNRTKNHKKPGASPNSVCFQTLKRPINTQFFIQNNAFFGNLDEIQRHFIPYLNVVFLLFFAQVLFCSVAFAQSTNSQNKQSWKFSFDQPQTVWKVESSNPNLKTLDHRHSAQEGYGKRGCEYMALQIPPDSGSVMLGMRIGTGRLSDDVLPTVYIKSNKTGLRFMLRVILPLTQEEVGPRGSSGGQTAPLAILLAGGTYSFNGTWQRLRIDRPLDLLKKQALDLSREGRNIDITNAYYDMAYLDINGGEGELNLWIDDFDITGYDPVSPADFVRGSLGNPVKENVPRPPETTTPSANNSVPLSDDYNSLLANQSLQIPLTASNQKTVQVRTAGGTIFVNESMFFIRAIRYQNEPLEYLRQLGFNTIWMDTPPSEGLMIQAQELGLWIICPPPLTKPQWDVFSENSDTSYSPTYWDDKYYRVIAWTLGNVTKNGLNIEQTNRLCRRIRECDRNAYRPILAQADENLRDYSRQADAVIISRDPMYSSLDMKRYLRWHQDITCLIQPGTPRICVIQTQPDEKLKQSWNVNFPNEPLPNCIPYEQLQMTTFVAAGSGIRGIFFDSQSPLNASDPDTQYRSRSLELINTRLSITDSFFAAGNQSSLLPTTDKNLRYVMISVPNKGRLLLPLYLPQYAQYSLRGLSSPTTTITAPNIPTTYQAYRLTSNGLETINATRQTGDLKLEIDSQVDWSMILLARESNVIASIFNRLKNYDKRRSSVLLQELTANRLENFRQWFNADKASKEEIALYNAATGGLNRSNWAINQGLWSESDKSCYDAMNALRILEFSYWSSIVGTVREPNFHPAAVSFRTMRLFYLWHQKMQSFRQSENILPVGNFESVEEFLDSNWKLYLDEKPNKNIDATGDINPRAAYNGNSGLRITAQTKDGMQKEIALLDRIPIAIMSPAIQVEPYELVKITCNVNIIQQLDCTVDGLTIREVSSSDALTCRLFRTVGWQHIVLFRNADKDGKIQLSFELTGIGEAFIDDVRITRLVPSSVGEKVE